MHIRVSKALLGAWGALSKPHCEGCHPQGLHLPRPAPRITPSNPSPGAFSTSMLAAAGVQWWAAGGVVCTSGAAPNPERSQEKWQQCALIRGDTPHPAPCTLTLAHLPCRTLQSLAQKQSHEPPSINWQLSHRRGSRFIVNGTTGRSRTKEM